MIPNRSSSTRILRTTLSETQRMVLALTRTVSGTLSFIASSIIIYKLYLKYQEKKKHSQHVSNCTSIRRSSLRSSLKHKGENNTYHRLLLGVSILDVMYSFWCALSVLPAPPSTGGVFAHGTIQTCATQAFFTQLATSIVLYMAMLNTYFMLKIRYNIPDVVIVKSYEMWFHIIPISFWMISGVLGLYLKIFNSVVLPELGCWIGSYPRGCIYSNTCTRGYMIYEYLDWYVWSFAYIWLFLCVVVILVNSVLIYTAIWKQEQRNASYLAAIIQVEGSTNQSSSGIASFPQNNHDLTLGPDETDDNDMNRSTNDRCERSAHAIKQSRIAAVQSCLYLSSALFTAVWSFLPWVGYKLMVEARVRFFFAFVFNIIGPSQGIFNLFIFVRLLYLRLRESNKDWSRWKCIKQCLFTSE